MSLQDQGRSISQQCDDDDSRLAEEYRACLLLESTNSTFRRYLKLLSQLLVCQSARILCSLSSPYKEVSRFDRVSVQHGNLDTAFCETVAFRKLVVSDALECTSDASKIFLEVAGDLRSFVTVPLITQTLELGLLVIVDDKPRHWSEEEIEAIEDVASILMSNLQVKREQSMLTIQKGMQRSLVQFVRGNLLESTRQNDASSSRLSASLPSELDDDLDSDDTANETIQVETSRMNIMFDFSARLIRRTLRASGCVLLNIEELVELENVESDVSVQPSIMGACFLKNLRSTEWHEDLQMENERLLGQQSGARSLGLETKTRSVPRKDVFNTRSLTREWLRELLYSKPRALFYSGLQFCAEVKAFLPADVSSCMIAPIYDSQCQAFALIVVFNVSPRPFLRYEGHYLEAFSSSIYAEVLNQNLIAADESKALFISKISHEFRTPLHGILASAEFLNDMPDITPSQLGFVQTIDTCGRTLLDIINHILEYSKLKFGKKTLNNGPVNLEAEATLEDFDVIEVTEQVLKTAYSSYEFKRISEQIEDYKTESRKATSEEASSESSRTLTLERNIEVVIDSKFRSQGYLVHSDKGAFYRVLLNLMGNALRFTLKGHIIIRVELCPSETEGLEQLSLSVADTGIGISRSFLTNLFKPFSQEDEFSAGTGLGLSIVQELSMKLHGTVNVKSTKNVGSSFVLSYPIMTRAPQKTLFSGNSAARELRGTTFHFPLADDTAVNASATLVRSVTVSILTNWFNMIESPLSSAHLLITDDNVTDPTRTERTLNSFSGPILTLSSTVVKYESGLKGSAHKLQSFVAKPCGPNRLGEAITHCLAHAKVMGRLEPTMDMLYDQKRESLATEDEESVCSGAASTVRANPPGNITGGYRRSVKEEREEQSLADAYELNNVREEVDPDVNSTESFPRIQHTSVAFNGRPTGLGVRRPSLTRRRSSKYRSPPDEPCIMEGSEEPAGNPVASRGSEPECQVTPSPVEVKFISMHRQDTDESTDRGSDRKRHVLIVEDNPVNMMLLVRFAKQQRLKVSTAVNGALAVEAVQARKRPFDLILIDINMPVMNGFQAISRIRKHEDYQAGRHREECTKHNHEDCRWSATAKVMALTGLSSEADRAEAKRRGADDFMTKPIKMKELARILTSWNMISDSSPTPADVPPTLTPIFSAATKIALPDEQDTFSGASLLSAETAASSQRVATDA